MPLEERRQHYNIVNDTIMSEYHHPPNNDRSVPQSEALPTMSGGSHVNQGDMNHHDNNTAAYNNTSNIHHHPRHSEGTSWGGGNHPSLANGTYNNTNNHHHHHRAPPPHGSYPHPPPRGHEPPHHHHHHHRGGYPPPPPSYSSSPPNYVYPPLHDSHYHPPPHHSSSVHHYPSKYSHHQMYHHPPPPPGYYHQPPPPPHYQQHHYHQQHHGMAPHGSYPPPHYSNTVMTQEAVSPPSIPHHRDDAPSIPHHHHHPQPPAMTHTIAIQSNQQPLSTVVNMVTPSIYTASTPAPASTPAASPPGGARSSGTCSSKHNTTNMLTPNPSSLHNQHDGRNASAATTNEDDVMNSPATKELFASTPRYLSNAGNTTAGNAAGFASGSGSGSQYKKRRQQQVHKSILSKGLLPLDHNNKNDDNVDAKTGQDDEKFSGLEDSLLLPASRYDTAETNSAERNSRETNSTGDKSRHCHKEAEIGRSEWMSEAAATAANTAAQISHSIHSAITNNNNSSNKVTYPHQMAELQSISNQARAQIAKMKKQRTTSSSSSSRQVQQMESQKVADIARMDVVFNDRSCSPNENGAAVNGIAATNATDNNSKTTTTTKKPHNQTRYKDKDGFLYYRRVGNKHYKKLFEKGLVPKDDRDDEEGVSERVNAIQMVITTAAAGAAVEKKGVEKDGVVGSGGSVQSGFKCDVPVVHLPNGGGKGVEDGDDGKDLNRHGTEERVDQDTKVLKKEEEADEQESLQLPRRETQLPFYSHDETKPVNSNDGYELRVVPHDDGNDFHVELIKAEDVEKKEEEESLMKQHGNAEENSSLPSMESEKVEGSVDGGTTMGGSKKNDGEFDTAVDSILDAAETIAKRATPRSSPVSLPQSQYQQTDNFDLPGVSSATKRKCEDMIQGYQEEKRQRSNSSVAAFHPRAYSAPSTFSYPPPDTVRPSPPPHETSVAPGPSPKSHADESAPNNAYSQIISQDRKEKRGRRTYCYPHPSVDLTEYYSSRQVSKTKKEELTALALCAASHIQKEPVLFRAILLNMALERERYSPKKHSGGAPTHLKNLALKRLSSQNGSAADVAFLSAVENSGKKVIRDGFFWKDVPELEKVLQKHMMEYYFMSENRPQSKKQQQFNNRLVSLVYQEAIARGFVFDPVSFALDGHNPLDFPSTTAPTECAGNWIVPPGFNHKKLRDRIRCYYKTHVQNSKKRLGTLLKNPNKERNRDILLRLVNELRSQEHIELSSDCVTALKRLKAEQDSIKGTVSTPDGPSSETSSHPASTGYADDHSQQTTTPCSPRATISDGGSGSSSSTSHSVENPHDAQSASTTFSPFKHASLLSSMRQLDSQRH